MSKKSKTPQEPISGSADASEFEYARENATADSPKPAARSGQGGKPAAADSPSGSDESEFKYEKREN